MWHWQWADLPKDHEHAKRIAFKWAIRNCAGMCMIYNNRGYSHQPEAGCQPAGPCTLIAAIIAHRTCMQKKTICEANRQVYRRGESDTKMKHHMFKQAAHAGHVGHVYSSHHAMHPHCMCICRNDARPPGAVPPEETTGSAMAYIHACGKSQNHQHTSCAEACAMPSLRRTLPGMYPLILLMSMCPLPVTLWKE